jgi:exodeoxyribonuclease-5
MTILNDGQEKALAEIMASANAGTRHLLTGYAGTGKTFLMQSVVKNLKASSLRGSVVVTAPTHKAVQVLSRKMTEAGIEVEAMTIHSLLGLKPAPEGEKSVLKRSGQSQTSFYKFIVIDECSMVGADLMDYIENDLRFHWVLFVGDPAQLPPVEEKRSRSFDIDSKSELTEIVRQEADNPILSKATALREQQGKEVDWSWCTPADGGHAGVFLAGDDPFPWMKDAFTSDEFKADNDAFRFLAYTNERVRAVNARVREWIYGQTSTPFVPGERVVCRKPIMSHMGRVAFVTNEEATVKSIKADVETYHFPAHEGVSGRRALPEWERSIPVWKVTLEGGEAGVVCTMPQNQDDVRALDRLLVSEAKTNSKRWFDRFSWQDTVADLRHVYALTVHSSQGSTFDNCFVDVRDCSKIERSRPLEMQQLLYVAVTRPRHALVLVGA